MTADIPSTPAATLVVVRDRAGAAPELLMVERAAAMTFAGGALVFPGGRIEPADHVVAADDALTGAHGLEPDDSAARVAAIRETIEESGIAVGFATHPAPADLARLRDGLSRGEDFGALLRRSAQTLDLGALAPFARWRPNFRETRVFDTRFYVARTPADAPDPIVDATENVRVFWSGAAETLAVCERGEARIIFPTRRNLERLAAFASYADIEADARRHPIDTVTPWIEERDGVAFLCIPEGCGYPVTAEPLDRARRM